MSRPEKNTVEYIPLDCQFSDSMQAVEKLYGNDGFVVWVKLLQKLGRTENYIIDVRTKLQWTLFYSLFGLSENRVKEILDTLSELECIDNVLWKKGLIYSKNFVKRISVVYRKRKYELKNINDILEEKNVSVELTGVSVEETPEILEETPSLSHGNAQSKVKESKVKKIKEINIKKKDFKIFGEFQNVQLTDEQFKKLQDLYKERIMDAIEILSGYIASKGVKYKNHYAVLGRHNWVYKRVFDVPKQEEKGEFNYV